MDKSLIVVIGISVILAIITLCSKNPLIAILFGYTPLFYEFGRDVSKATGIIAVCMLYGAGFIFLFITHALYIY